MSSELGQLLDGGGINPDEVEPRDDFTPMPPGWRAFEIEAADVNDTKSGKGKLLKLTLSVIGQEYNGRKVFPQINIVNPSAKATEIGRQELAELARACGISYLNDENLLLGNQVMARLKIEPAEGKYEAQNAVKGYKALDGSAPAKTPSTTAPPAQQQSQHQNPAPEFTADGQKKMPWEK